MESIAANKFKVPALGQPRSKDLRDFKHHLVYGTVDDLTTLPTTLNRRPLFPIKDQKNTSFCTAFATAAASEYQEKVELSPLYQAAKIGQLAGYPIVGGADPRIALQAAVLYGSLEQKDVPAGFTLEETTAAKLADWNYWPANLDPKAWPHEKESFFDATTGPHDIFDNMRVALALAKDEDGVLICTSQWYEEWNNPLNGIVPQGVNAYGWHDWDIIDYTNQAGTQYMVAQNSYGDVYGDHGLFYLTRENINMAFAVPFSGASIYRDLDPNIVKRFDLHNASLSDIFFELFRRWGMSPTAAYKLVHLMFN